VHAQFEVSGFCYDFSGVTDFIDQPHVRVALGVGDIRWGSCSYQVDGNFAADVMKGYQKDAAFLLDIDMRVLIYAGNADLVCHWLVGRWFLSGSMARSSATRACNPGSWVMAMASLRTAHNLKFPYIFKASCMVRPGPA